MELLTTTRDDLRAWDVPPRVPLLVLRSTHVFPLGVAAVQMTNPVNVTAIQALESGSNAVVLVRADSGEADAARFAGATGVVASVLDRMNLAGEAVQVTLQGRRRVQIAEVDVSGAYPVAKVLPVLEPEVPAAELNLRIQLVLRLAEKLATIDPAVSPEAVENLRANTEDPSHFADLVAAQIPFALHQRDQLIEDVSPASRLQRLATFLQQQIERAQVQREVEQLTGVQIERGRREYLLRQQLQAIREELGEDDSLREARELRARLDALGLPPPARAEAERELERLERLTPASAEFQVVRTYLDWLLELPWSTLASERGYDPSQVRAVLDLGHYGLDEPKRRITEYLAVRKLAPQARPPILCFVGPPGVGKTSLGRAAAEALGRPFGRMSLGGVDDEAAIRGHRRTYIGALPGKLIQELRRVKVKNPVLMIDEIDKLGAGRPGHGDPSAALLEVLDPEQNIEFVDHYLGVPFDLSQVLFIATANSVLTIPDPLLDRMEVIELPGYTLDEKVSIARKHLLPVLLPEHGLTESELALDDATLKLVVEGYAREAGVRGMHRQLATVLRRVATRKAGGETGPWTVDAALIDQVLGQPRFVDERALGEPAVGVANGLAWTPTGGDILRVEAIAMPGSGNFQVTGRLGEVMVESVQAAMSWVRSRADQLGIDRKAVGQSDVHVHFPEGAIPKDGPSAGVTIAVVLASLFTGRPIRCNVAMTGEITLTGRVLPIGGLREKLAAAVRSGVAEVLVPKSNAPDLRDVPESITRVLKVSLVETADEVVALALMPGGRARPATSRTGRKRSNSTQRKRR
ncbi:MAG TPA: endopeptidase La [Gemmatimonadales bacterium]|nr:endopeptidase La [Gemmatimonadales bacterium]